MKKHSHARTRTQRQKARSRRIPFDSENFVRFVRLLFCDDRRKVDDNNTRCESVWYAACLVHNACLHFTLYSIDGIRSDSKWLPAKPNSNEMQEEEENEKSKRVLPLCRTDWYAISLIIS